MVVLLGGGGRDLGLDEAGERISRGIRGYADIKAQRKSQEQGDRAQDQTDRRLDQADTAEARAAAADKAEEEWRRYQREQRELDKAARRQENRGHFRKIFNEDPDLADVLDFPGNMIDPNSDIPVEIQREAYEALKNPSGERDQSAKAAKLLKLKAISQRAGQLRRMFERVAMPDTSVEGGAKGGGAEGAEQNREQMIPFETAKNAIEQLTEEEANPTGEVDLDDLDKILSDAIRSESYRRAEYEVNDAAVARIDNVINIRGQRALEDGMSFGGGSGMDPDVEIEVRALRDQIAAYGLTGKELASAEQRIYGLLSGRTGGSASRSGSSRTNGRGSDATPHDRALELFKALPEGERNLEMFRQLKAEMMNEDSMSRVDPRSDPGGIRAMGGGQGIPVEPGAGGAGDVASLEQAIASGEIDAKNPGQVEAWLRANVTPEQAAAMAGKGAPAKPKNDTQGGPTASGASEGRTAALGPKARSTGKDTLTGRPAKTEASSPKHIQVPDEKLQSTWKAMPKGKDGKSFHDAAMEKWRGRAEEDLEDLADAVAKADQVRGRAAEVAAGKTGGFSGRARTTSQATEEFNTANSALDAAIAEYEAAYGPLPADLKRNLAKTRGK